MRALIGGALDPSIDVISAADGAIELQDRRTGFRVVIEELEDQADLEHQRGGGATTAARLPTASGVERTADPYQ
jgi:hypothetical protein